LYYFNIRHIAFHWKLVHLISKLFAFFPGILIFIRWALKLRRFWKLYWRSDFNLRVLSLIRNTLIMRIIETVKNKNQLGHHVVQLLNFKFCLFILYFVMHLLHFIFSQVIIIFSRLKNLLYSFFDKFYLFFLKQQSISSFNFWSYLIYWVDRENWDDQQVELVEK
jgi:hypothetical protein